MTAVPRTTGAGPVVDPAEVSGYADHPERVGFFTDTSICIGCKACEVACKEWNHVPDSSQGLTGMSYDNSLGLGADRWRHVAFIEQRKPVDGRVTGTEHAMAPAPVPQTPFANPAVTGTGLVGDELSGGDPTTVRTELRWLMSSDVCKHCTEAACLDVCPTGSLFRTEFGTVVVQEDICNGCGYCVPACPYGVIDQREGDGRVWKCTLCYDRLQVGQQPACAKACPTESIRFGPLDELRAMAGDRVRELQSAGVTDAQLYGDDPDDGVGGAGSIFLLLDQPEVYGLPPDPVVTTRDLPAMWRRAALAAGVLAAGVAASFVGGRR